MGSEIQAVWKGQSEEQTPLETASSVRRNIEKDTLSIAGNEKVGEEEAVARTEEDEMEYLPPGRLALLTISLALVIFVVSLPSLLIVSSRRWYCGC